MVGKLTMMCATFGGHLACLEKELGVERAISEEQAAFEEEGSCIGCLEMGEIRQLRVERHALASCHRPSGQTSRVRF